MASSSSPPLSLSSAPSPTSPLHSAPKPHLLFPTPFNTTKSKISKRLHNLSPLHASSPPNNSNRTVDVKPSPAKQETVFFNGGTHYGDLVVNLLLGFTLLWMPLTIAAVFRAFFLRYRFTNLRVTVLSGLIGGDRSDFTYKVIKDVQVVPRFIGEWGDVVITLTDGTKVDLRSVPKFREIADYCLYMAGIQRETAESDPEEGTRPKGF